VSEVEISLETLWRTTQTSRRSLALERERTSLWFFETLQSRRRDGRLAVQRDVEAQERRFRGSMEPRPEGQHLEGERLGEDRRVLVG
jgi:hypothetical protein